MSDEALKSARRSKTYATIGADKDLVADGPGGVPCIRILVGGAGDIALIYADGATDTIAAVPANTQLEVQAAKIVAASTTATKVTVFW